MLYKCYGDVKMEFCDTIKKLRQHLLLSQEDFGKELGITFATVNRWETGKTLPRYKTLKKIEELCKKYNFDFAEIRVSIVRDEGKIK